MEDNKYYIPQIEEFHIGFEYERKYISFEEWKKEIYLLHYDCNLNKLNVRIIDGEIRVKYLDQSDIESLGFIFSSKAVDDWYTLNKSIRLSSGHRFIKFKLQHDHTNSFSIEDDHKYNIKIYGLCDNQEDVLFEGIIKNKSELKVLLKQLGIDTL